MRLPKVAMLVLIKASATTFLKDLPDAGTGAEMKGIHHASQIKCLPLLQIDAVFIV